MSFTYITNPKTIEQNSFKAIRSLISLTHLNNEEQQIVMRIVHSCGSPNIATQIRFSKNACQSGLHALSQKMPLLCDVEMVKQGLTKRLIPNDPLCFINHTTTIKHAKRFNETRSMSALQQWTPYLANSIVLIGNAPTALFRLLELLQQGANKPALIIGIPVGFIGAEESKQALWDTHQALGIECITLLGKEGGSAITASVCNALLRCLSGEYY